MATPPIEEARMPQDLDAATISAIMPQYFPPFDKENPKLWFLQAEAALRTSRITSDSARFDYIIQRLPTDISRLLENIIESPPASNKYETLKSELLELFGKSEETRVRQLLRTCRMGDEKPSHFLQRMRSMVDEKVPDTILKTIFLEQIPQSLHNILIINQDADLSKLAKIADRIMEFSLPQISNIDKTNMATPRGPYRADGHFENNMADNQQLKGDLADIKQQLAQLTYRIATMETNFSHQRSFQRRSRSRDRRLQSRDRRLQSRDRRLQSRDRRSQSRDRRSPVPQYTPTEGLCYYHFNFGARAYRCQKPCNWSTTTTTTETPHNTDGCRHLLYIWAGCVGNECVSWPLISPPPISNKIRSHHLKGM